MIVCRVSKIGHGYFMVISLGAPYSFAMGANVGIPIPKKSHSDSWTVRIRRCWTGTLPYAFRKNTVCLVAFFRTYCVEDIVVLDTTWVTPHLPISSEQWQSPTFLKSPGFSAGNVHISLGQHHLLVKSWLMVLLSERPQKSAWLVGSILVGSRKNSLVFLPTYHFYGRNLHVSLWTDHFGWRNRQNLQVVWPCWISIFANEMSVDFRGKKSAIDW